MEDASKELRRLERRTNKKLKELSGTSVSGGGDGIRTFKTVADLEAANGNVDEVVLLLGYYSVGDFGQPVQLVCSEDESLGVNSYEFANGIWGNLYHEGPINVLWFGAHNDGTEAFVTTAAIQKAIDEAGSYFYEGRSEWVDARTVFFPRGEYLTNSTIIVEPGVTLTGETPHPGGVKLWNEANHGTKIRPTASSANVGGNKLYGFRMRSNCTIQNMVIQHADTNYNDQRLASDAQDDYLVLKGWANNGIAIGSMETDEYGPSQGHAYGCCVRDCIIAGFEYAVYFYHSGMGGGRYRLENLLIDCWNGIHLIGTGDICRLRDIHMWPLMEAVGDPPEWRLSERGGTAYKIERGGDWAQLSGCMAFGYQVGFELKDANMTSMYQCSFDGSDTGVVDGFDFRIRSNPVYGLKIIGKSAYTIVSGFQTGGHPKDGCIPVYIDIEYTGQEPSLAVVFDNCTFTGFDDPLKMHIQKARYVTFNNCVIPSGQFTMRVNGASGAKIRINDSIIPSLPGQSIVNWNPVPQNGDTQIVLHNTIFPASPNLEDQPSQNIIVN